MRVCHVGDHCCIRMTKEAVALKALGLEVSGIGFQPPWGWVELKRFLQVHSEEHLVEAVRATDHLYDLYHVHNTPDWLVPSVRKATEKPIVYDEHDPDCMQWGHPCADEKAALDACDAVVHVSEPCRAKVEEIYRHGKPEIVLPSHVNATWMTDLPEEVSFQGIVYEGGLSEHNGLKDPYTGKTQPSYKYLPPICSQLFDAGWRLHLFTGSPLSPAGTMAYMEAGAIPCGKLPYPVMLAALRAYGLGWFGTEHPNEKYHAAEPNKLYEYISQGVVPVVYRSRNSEEFVRRTGLGIVLEKISDLKEAVREAPEVRRRILARRHELTMERNIGPLVDLYGAAIERRKVA